MQVSLLKSAFDSFGRLPFPKGSADEQLSELHAQLAAYDASIAGLVTRLIKGISVSKNELRLDLELKHRLKRISQARPQNADEARAYLEYLSSLTRLVEIAREHALE